MLKLSRSVVILCILSGACSGKGSSPASPTSLGASTPPTTRVVFMTIPTINLPANVHGSYPGVPESLGPGTVEVIVKPSTDSADIAIYVFRLPRIDAPDYATEYEKMNLCRSNDGRWAQNCVLAIVSDESASRDKRISFQQTEAGGSPARFSYTVVIRNRGSGPVTVTGEFAWTP